MNDIHYDIFFHIFEYLDLDDIINSRLISIYIDDIFNDILLWKTYCERDYEMAHKVICLLSVHKLSYKNTYKKCHDINVLKHKLNMHQSIHAIIDLLMLDLREKNIIEIPHEIESLVDSPLQVLKLYDNKISEISQITQLVNLQWIYLSKNNITKISRDIGLLVHLKGLDLSFNKIADIQQIIQYVSSHLQWLSLYHNEITEILQIEKLTRSPLRMLNLANNKIKEMPCNIELLDSLREVYISGNKIKNIPQEIRNKMSRRGCKIYI